MTEDELNKINDSIKEKIGDESFAMIGDDLGKIITGRDSMEKEIKSRDETILDLKSKNEKLVDANASLFKQIPVTSSEETNEEEEHELVRPEDVDLNDVFDEKGNFKR